MKEVKRLIRCDNGHFFDGGKYDECPHCKNKKTPEITVFVPEAKSEKDYNESKYNYGGPLYNPPEASADDPEDTVSKITEEEKKPEPAIKAAPRFYEEKPSNGHTVHYFQKALGTEPVVGWLVCVEGMHSGEDFKIKSGRNFIGRSGDMNISLSGDRTVSRDKHAILTYDPRSNTFVIQPGESAELTYLNNEAVLVPTKLKLNDRIALGETELIFVPFCSDDFSWEKQKHEN